MIRIEKPGATSKTVARSAYDNYFENAGWSISGAVGSVSAKQTQSDDLKDEWDDAEEEIEKPISEMNLEELQIKAAEMGLDVSGLSTPKQIRDKIRKNM